MDKKIILGILSLLFCNVLFSQQVEDDFQIPDIPKSYTISIGPKAGVGWASGSSSSNNYSIHGGLVFQLGANFNIHFGHRYESSPAGTGLLGFSAELLYECRNPKTDYGTLTMHCIEVPLLCRYYPVSSMASEFALEAGITLMKVLKCSPDQMQFGNTVYQMGQLKSSDIMATLGACYQTPFNVSFDLRYNLGTSPLAGNLDSRMSTLVLSIEYLF